MAPAGNREVGSAKLVLDAPWSIHASKLILWYGHLCLLSVSALSHLQVPLCAFELCFLHHLQPGCSHVQTERPAQIDSMCRVAFEVCVILLVVPIWRKSPGPSLAPAPSTVPGDDCRLLDWTAVCAYSPLTHWPAIAISFLSGVYSSCYTSCIMRVYWQLEQQLYRDTRAARVLWCIQVRALAALQHLVLSLLALKCCESCGGL